MASQRDRRFRRFRRQNQILMLETRKGTIQSQIRQRDRKSSASCDLTETWIFKPDREGGKSLAPGAGDGHMKCDKCDVIVSRLRETQSAESRVAELLSALNKAAQPAATSPSLSDVPFTQLPPLSIECRVCRDEVPTRKRRHRTNIKSLCAGAPRERRFVRKSAPLCRGSVRGTVAASGVLAGSPLKVAVACGKTLIHELVHVYDLVVKQQDFSD
eukprot:scaffold2117_cov241-Pinguiococcus_pyrenoidosus.AAC.22